MGEARDDDRSEGLNHAVRKRSVRIAGHRTSVSLEQPFWTALQEIAAGRRQSVAALIAEVDRTRTGNLSSALRVFVLAEARRGRLSSPAAGPEE